jgi:DNA-binding protein H-NS
MPTYLELKQQIESLQVEADALKVKERSEVIEKMMVAIQAYDISAKELGFPRGIRSGTSGRGSRPRNTAAKKFRRSGGAYADDQGNTWGGRGPRPKWLREALASGAKLEDFANARRK